MTAPCICGGAATPPAHADGCAAVALALRLEHECWAASAWRDMCSAVIAAALCATRDAERAKFRRLVNRAYSEADMASVTAVRGAFARLLAAIESGES